MTIVNPFSNINPATFSADVQQQVEEKSQFVTSSVLAPSESLSELCETGSGYGEPAVVLHRTQTWSGAKLEITDNIEERIAEYEARCLKRCYVECSIRSVRK
jgi:hypothetical protein